MNQLTVDSVIYSYGDNTILKSIFFSIRTGDIFGIVGRNGSGKTTLFKKVIGLLYGGHDVTKINNIYIPRNKKCNYFGYLPQICFLPKNFKVEKIIKFFLKDETLRNKLLHNNKIASLLNTKASALSGGERRYLELHLVLVLDKPFVFLDEPFTELDPKTIEEMTTSIQAKRSVSGFIITDHNHYSIREACNRLAIIRNSTLYEIENTKESLIKSGYLSHQ